LRSRLGPRGGETVAEEGERRREGRREGGREAGREGGREGGRESCIKKTMSTMGVMGLAQ